MTITKLLPTKWQATFGNISVNDETNMYTDVSSSTYSFVELTGLSVSGVKDFYLGGFEKNKIPAGSEVTGYTVRIKIANSRGKVSTAGISLYGGARGSITDGAIIPGTTLTNVKPGTLTLPTDGVDWDVINSLVQSGNLYIHIPIQTLSSDSGGGIRVYGAEIEVTYEPPKKYVTGRRLQHFWDNAKNYIDTEIPTNVSDLANDAGYLTQHQSLSDYALKSEIPTVPTNVSAFTNDSGYINDLSPYIYYSQNSNTVYINSATETGADDVITIEDEIGDLSQLTTTAKTNLVSAINEVAATSETNAVTAAQTASTKASEASASAQSAASSAQTATDKATLASQKAAAASESATLATAKASAAATSETNAVTAAQTATTKASEAAASATSAQEYDESAQQSAVNAQTAQGLAEQAQAGAQTAQGLAEDARDEAQQIKDNVEDAIAGKADSSEIGDLSQLTTTTKTDLVSAINEENEAVAGINERLTQFENNVGVHTYSESVVNGTAPNTGNTNAVTIADFIPCEQGDKVKISTTRPLSASGNKYGYYFYEYNSDGTRIKTYDTVGITQDEYTVSEATAAKVKYSILEYDSEDNYVSLRKTDFDGYSVYVTVTDKDTISDRIDAFEDRIDTIEDDVEDNGLFVLGSLNWVNGTLVNGNVTTGTKYRVVTNDILDIKWSFRLTAETGYKFFFNEYDSSGSLIPASSVWCTDSVFTAGKRIRIVIARTSENTSEVADIDAFVSKLNKKEISGEIKEEIDVFREITPFTWTDGYAINVTTGTAVATSSFSCTDFIPINGSRLTQRCYMQGSFVGTAFYDVNKEFISGVKLSDFGVSFESVGSIGVPEKAVFFRTSAVTIKKDKQTASWSGKLNRYLNELLPKDETLQFLKNARHVPSDAVSPLTLMYFSDLHGDKFALDRIMRDSSKYSEIANSICLGDIVVNTAEEISGWWDESVLTCIGNHDTASYTAGTGYNWTALSMANRSAYYIEPFESGWGITHASGTSYYYKDYATQKVRLIVMDAMLYTDNGTEATEQTAWLENLLSDAITNNLHVLIAIHAPHGGASPVECSFSRYGQGTMPTYTDCNTPQAVIDVVATKITAGLKFVGYLVGHTHQDNIWDAENDGKQLMYCITCANVTSKTQWTKSDQDRGITSDAYNVITIDTANTLVKIIRGGGANMDDHMRTRKAICFDYSTGEMVGEIQ